MGSIYQIDTIWLFMIFMAITIVVSLCGLYIFKSVDTPGVKCGEHNAIVAVLIGVMSVFLGVMVSFLIVTAWGLYSQADLDNEKEAEALYILYQVVSTLPNTEDTQQLIIEYIEYVINEEFPAISEGNPPPSNKILIKNLQRALYDYNPEGSQQTVLYQRSIELVDIIVNFRTNRITIAESGLNPLMWWVTILDSLLLIFMSWFLTCTGFFHYILVVMISVYVAGGLFTTYILSNPFRGSSGLTARPFQEALDDIQRSSL